MSFEKRILVITCSIVALFGAATAYADGWCANNFRDATTSEKATMTSVLETVKKALPPPPQGWVTSGDESFSFPTSVCRDQESSPWPYDFSRYYRRVDDQEERTKAMQAAATDMAAQVEAKQPRLDAIMAKMTALSEQLLPAVQANDAARVEELNKEIEKVSAEYKQVVEEGGTTEKMNAAAAAANRDIEMTVRVEINPNYEAPVSGAESVSPPAGVQSAFRWSETSGNDVEQTTMLFLLGRWEPRSEGSFQAAPRSNATPVSAHAISIRVGADKGRFPAIIDAIDFGALAKTLTE